MALTDVTYKLVMGIIKVTFENHLKMNKQVHDMQAAYLEKKRIADTLFILTFCIEKKSWTEINPGHDGNRLQKGFWFNKMGHTHKSNDEIQNTYQANKLYS